MSDIRDVDWERIADLALMAGIPDAPLRAGKAEISASADETRLKFNAPTPVRYVALRAGGWQLELFHWLEEDEWELVHASRFA